LKPGSPARALLAIAALIALAAAAIAADLLPPKPAAFFNDYAGVVPAGVASSLNTRLADFERQTSNQLVVAVFKKLPDNAALEDFTQRTAAAWGVGGKKNSNGIVLFVFVDDRKVRVEVGYGLEGAVPDVLADQIIRNEIVPAFRQGDYGLGLTRGIDALMAATRGEYKGTGRTHAQNNSSQFDPITLIFLGIFGVIILASILRARHQIRNGTFIGSSGSAGLGGGTFWSSGGGGGGSGGGGDSFSGGGGDFGGGGSSGSW